MQVEMKLLPYQEEIMFSKCKRIGMLSGSGAGKSWLIGRFLYYKMAENPNHQWIVCSPTTQMLRRSPVKYTLDFLRDIELKEIRTGKPNHLEYRFNKSDLIMEFYNGIVYFIPASEPDRMQGIHCKGIICDEAGLVDKRWYSTAIQRLAFTGGQLALFTTWYSLNWLYEDFYVKWLNGDPDYFIVNPPTKLNPYFPLSEIERARKDMPDKLFRMFYLNEIPKEMGNQMFSIEDIKKAFDNEIDYKDDEFVITCDIAGEGDDFTQISAWQGYKQLENLTIEKNTQPEVQRMLEVFSDRYNGARIIIDSTGIGTACGQYLRENGYNCQSVNFGSNAKEKKKYKNKRAEMYFNLQKEIKQGNVSLLPDRDLEQELRAINYEICKTSRRFMIEEKSKIKSVIGRSPDKSDCIALRFVPKKESGLIM